MSDVCEKCGTEKEFLSGEPAHKSNLFCPKCDIQEPPMTDSFDTQPKISLEPFLLKEEDVAKFVNTDFDLQKDIIEQACKRVAMLNEKTAEQALILKLNNRIAEQQRVIDEVNSRYEKMSELYSELLHQVHNKIPGESRHETAKRIILEHESRESSPQATR